MSRSEKKTPIFGIAGTRSEKQDKRIWHKRMRVLERTRQSSHADSEMENHLPVRVLEAINIWSMGKDGRLYWGKTEHLSFAIKLANRKAKTAVEIKSLTYRNLHKIMSK